MSGGVLGSRARGAKKSIGVEKEEERPRPKYHDTIANIATAQREMDGNSRVRAPATKWTGPAMPGT